MASQLRAVKGMNDILPGEIDRWHRIEATFARMFGLAGYREVRTPYVEVTGLFVRTIGETTDVVEKEMYSFTHHDEPLTLRPEGTAGAARAYVEHAVHNAEPISKWWYMGPMFRAERPQRGRYRQFYQAGAECFGDRGPACDAEMIDTLVGFLRAIGVADVEVLVNSLGSGDTRARYTKALVAALEPKKATLSAESQRRLEANPLRILDSKDPRDREAVLAAPPITELLDDADRAHYEALKRDLDALGTPYREDPKLVRGLDYYTRTLFEIKGAKDRLGAGDTLVGGGRYDGMVAELGGPEVPAIGFAAGLERLVIASGEPAPAPTCDVYVAYVAIPETHALVLGKELRAAGVRCEVDTRGASFKSQLRRANALGARIALILGEKELASGVVQLKDMDRQQQSDVPRADVVRAVVERIAQPRATEAR
jgi:histidyl-tRNA synthetase